MKAILEFDCKDPDELMAHRRCIKALDMAIVLFEITRNLKNTIDNDPNIDYNYGLTDLIFEEINELMEEHNINLDELIV
ncbi:MAG: hypothetical protein KKC37_17090 [Proteobacteria bacterium]|nr:hypothetical protein [Pseudomonadota bacterium]